MPHFTDEKTEDQRGKMAFSRAQSRKALKPKSAAGRGVRGGCSARLGVGDPAAHLSPGEASRATTERKRCPRAMPVWAGGGALVGSGRRQTQAPEAAPAERSIESPGCPLALCAAALPAQRFSPHPPEGGSAQPVGRRAGLAAEEGAPPSAPLPAPHPHPRPRAHTCEGHTKARDSRRTASQTKAPLSPRPSSSSRRPGPRLPAAWRLQTACLPAPGLTELAALHAGGPPKPHARTRTPGLTHPHTTYTQVFLHTDPSTSHTRVHKQTGTLLYVHRSQYQPSRPSIGHSCTDTPSAPSSGPNSTRAHLHVCPGTPPDHVCPYSHPCTLTQDITHRQTFVSALPSAHRPCAPRHAQAGRPTGRRE